MPKHILFLYTLSFFDNNLYYMTGMILGIFRIVAIRGNSALVNKIGNGILTRTENANNIIHCKNQDLCPTVSNILIRTDEMSVAFYDI